MSIIRYQLTPFEGFEKAQEDTGEPRKPYAIFDACMSVKGAWPHSGQKRGNQLRETFLTSEDADDKVPFVFGKDFVSREHDMLSMRVHSPILNETIRKLVQYYPQYESVLRADGKEIYFPYPYAVPVHYWKELHQIKDAGRNGDATIKIEGVDKEFKCTKELHHHLGVFLNFIDEQYYSKKGVQELALYNQGLAKFDNLWLLFKPGEVVFAKVRGQFAGFVVVDSGFVRIMTKDGMAIQFEKHVIHVWNLAFNGDTLTRQAHTFFIDIYQGEKEISSLDIFPVKYLKDSGTSMKELIERGKSYYKIVCNLPSFKIYDGQVIDKKPNNVCFSATYVLLQILKIFSTQEISLWTLLLILNMLLQSPV